MAIYVLTGDEGNFMEVFGSKKDAIQFAKQCIPNDFSICKMPSLTLRGCGNTEVMVLEGGIIWEDKRDGLTRRLNEQRKGI